MRVVTAFGAAFTLAAIAFTITMLIKPPVSEAKPAASIDTYSLTLSAESMLGKNYDCN
ncbi:hypothetical protein [Methylobacterium iners]|uniref:Uncharacterized protein n=1 Tax=Methylobacterium iners TaxID=418707 RepID=A0ABQ4S5Z2_9HYPH|nr:hypothetical protein [Methylobacterium iners]GJD97095.1 hypothetical protein OCOJLMKI_4323 [Methylobacterium iners]